MECTAERLVVQEALVVREARRAAPAAVVADEAATVAGDPAAPTAVATEGVETLAVPKAKATSMRCSRRTTPKCT